MLGSSSTPHKIRANVAYGGVCIVPVPGAVGQGRLYIYVLHELCLSGPILVHTPRVFNSCGQAVLTGGHARGLKKGRQVVGPAGGMHAPQLRAAWPARIGKPMPELVASHFLKQIGISKHRTTEFRIEAIAIGCGAGPEEACQINATPAGMCCWYGEARVNRSGGLVPVAVTHKP